MSLSARAQFRYFRWRLWRLVIERHWFEGETRQVDFLWSNGANPETFRRIFKLWGCRHDRQLTVDRADGTRGEQCLDCPELFNYRLNPEETWLNKRYWEARRRGAIS
jgi:hypothetical protein